MRQFFMVMLVAIATGLLPATVRAENPNQAAAQKISDHISASGQLAKGKVAVRYLNGTVWLQGHVRDQEHLNKSVALVFATEGVTVNEVIRDELTIEGSGSNSQRLRRSWQPPLQSASRRHRHNGKRRQ